MEAGEGFATDAAWAGGANNISKAPPQDRRVLANCILSTSNKPAPMSDVSVQQFEGSFLAAGANAIAYLPPFGMVCQIEPIKTHYPPQIYDGLDMQQHGPTGGLPMVHVTTKTASTLVPRRRKTHQVQYVARVRKYASITLDTALCALTDEDPKVPTRSPRFAALFSANPFPISLRI